MKKTRQQHLSQRPFPQVHQLAAASGRNLTKKKRIKENLQRFFLTIPIKTASPIYMVNTTNNHIFQPENSYASYNAKKEQPVHK